ncbi:MAG TPA: PilZ domain-containing protein [Candidatus Dormibacteraeota bacterium]|nr:PilZ domain-containing protein [Candidatus Dormibacteraeota bacterium]
MRNWLRGKVVPTFPAGRRSKREVTNRRGTIVVNLASRPERIPCIIVDTSPEGFRLRTDFPLRRGQLVEFIPHEELDTIRCRVVWVGKAKYDGEVGLQTVVH